MVASMHPGFHVFALSNFPVPLFHEKQASLSRNWWLLRFHQTSCCCELWFIFTSEASRGWMTCQRWQSSVGRTRARCLGSLCSTLKKMWLEISNNLLMEYHQLFVCRVKSPWISLFNGLPNLSPGAAHKMPWQINGKIEAKNVKIYPIRHPSLPRVTWGQVPCQGCTEVGFPGFWSTGWIWTELQPIWYIEKKLVYYPNL